MTQRMVQVPPSVAWERSGVRWARTDGNGRGAEIRTRDLLLPKQARYQAALRPDVFGLSLRAVLPRQEG